MENKKYNMFITFEGGEGTGKSTTAKLLKARMAEKGVDAFVTREPGGAGLAFAEEVRKIIMNHGDIDPITELLLFEASRREHITKKILPALEKGKFVISDRFEDSTIVYQGMVKNVPTDIIKSANEIARGELTPSLVFIFDLNPEVGMRRIADGDRGTNRFDHEGLEFHKKVRDSYRQIAEENPEKYIIIDSEKPTEEIVEFIIDKIESYGN